MNIKQNKMFETCFICKKLFSEHSSEELGICNSKTKKFQKRLEMAAEIQGCKDRYVKRMLREE